MKKKAHFVHIPDWIHIYHPGKVTINNPEFHYYVSRSEQDQPVTLYQQQQDLEKLIPMRMFYTIEKEENYEERLKDSSGLKNFGHLMDLQQDEINKIPITKDQIYRESSWIKKYEPKRFIDLLTDELINRNLLTWLKSWDGIVFKKTHKIDTVPSLFKKIGYKSNFSSFHSHDYNYKKLILLAGPPGCGKTTLARVIATHCGYHYQEINASDDRSGRTLIQKIDALVSNQTIRSENKPTCVIIDEVDGALDSDSNGIKEVLQYLETGIAPGSLVKKEKTQKQTKKLNQASKYHKTHHIEVPTEKQQNKNYKNFTKKQGEQEQKRRTKIDRPVIFICNDPFVKGLRDLRGKAIVVHFNSLQEDRMVKRLKDITDAEGVYIETDILTRICQMSNNDVRSAVGILELMVKLKQQLGISAKEVINRMRFSYSKDTNSSTNDFLGKVMQNSKLNTQKDIFKTYQYSLSQHDNHGLLAQTFFHNILHNKQLLLNPHALCGLYGQMIKYDVAQRQSFALQTDPEQSSIFPYAYYRIHIRTQQQHKRMQFPSQYFQKYNKKKANIALIEKIIKGIPTSLQIFISSHSLAVDYLYLFWLTMQTSSVREEDILKCVYKLLSYGIKLGPRNAPNLFSPEIDVLMTFGGNKAEITMSNSSRMLMQENYEFLKLKSQLAGDTIFDNNKQNLESVINQLKKNRRRKRDSQNGQVKYKYLQGTGTEVKYDLKIGYFFHQKNSM